ncbi:hypothetical protein Tco_0353080 [Tanacetum coccineum]
MAISINSISSDSSEESVGLPAGRVILFGTISNTISDTTPTVTPPTTHVDTTLTPTEIPTVSPIVPPSPDYTPASPDYSPASDTEFDPSEDPSSDHIPPLLATSPFLSSTNDSLDSDIPDTPPSPTHETLSDSSSDDLSDSSSGHSSLDHSSPALPSDMRSSHQPSHSSFVGPSRKRSRSPTTSVSISSPTPGALSPARANLLPPPNRIRSSDSMMNLEDCLDEKPDIDPEIQAGIDECIAYVNALRAEGIDVRVVVETVAREEVETSTKGPVEVRVERVTHPAVSEDIPEPT